MRGHIRKRGAGYQIIVDLGRDESGKRKQKAMGGFKTEKEAEKALAKLISEIDKGEYNLSIASNENMPLRLFLDKWLATIKNNLKSKTYKTYEDLTKWYILPKLGDIKLKDLKAITIQEHYIYLQNDLGLSGTTACHVHNIINSSLNQALKWDLLYNNPCDKVKRPKRADAEIEVLDVEEVTQLFAALYGTSLYLPTVLAVTTGMRRSEILGLRWEDINLGNKTIYIKNQIKKEGDSFKLDPVKTDSSRRNILLLDFTVEVLKEEQKKQYNNREELQEHYNKGNYVCCMGDGRPYDPDYISRHFLRKMTTLTTKLEIPKVTFHELRHTHATILLKANVNPKVVSERLGHSKVLITLDTYSHVLPSMQQDAVDKLSKTMNL